MGNNELYCEVTECLLNCYGVCKCESHNNGSCSCPATAACLEEEDVSK